MDWSLSIDFGLSRIQIFRSFFNLISINNTLFLRVYSVYFMYNNVGQVEERNYFLYEEKNKYLGVCNLITF